MHRKANLISLALVFAALPGCAVSGGDRNFACPEPDGVTCRSALEVYEALDRGEELGAGKPAAPAIRVEPAPATARQASVIEGADGVLLFDAPVPTPEPTPLAQVASEETPLRTPAKVMRIWIAPWEDRHGDLVMASHVYTEIEGRRWRVAAPAPAEPPLLRLIQGGTKPAAKPDAAETRGSTGSTDQPVVLTNGRT